MTALTVKMSDVLKAEEGLTLIAQEKLPVKLAYSIAKLLRKVVKEIEFFSEKRTALIKEYGVENKEDTSKFEIPKEKLEDFNKQMKDLAELEVTLNGVVKVKLDDLIDAKISAPPAALYQLGVFLDDGEEVEEDTEEKQELKE